MPSKFFQKIVFSLTVLLVSKLVYFIYLNYSTISSSNNNNNMSQLSESGSVSGMTPGSELGECCTNKGDPIKPQNQKGVEVSIAGMNGYLVQSSKSHIYVIQSDIFGYKFANSRALADEVSIGTGYSALLWDQFNGDAFNKLPFTQEELKPWRANHPQASKSKLLALILEDLVLKQGFTNIYLHGICFGAKQSLDYLKDDSKALFESQDRGLQNEQIEKILQAVKAGVFSHPTFVAPEDPNKVIKPTLFNVAEKDEVFKPEARSLFEKILTQKNLGVFIEYPDQVHGFHTRGVGEAAKVQAALATKNTVQFLLKHK